MTGHSLGGALAAIVARELSLDAVTFNAVPENRVGTILGLPIVTTNIVHVGVAGDPIFNGRCNIVSILQMVLKTNQCKVAGHKCLLRSRRKSPNAVPYPWHLMSSSNNVHAIQCESIPYN
jgi:putative lipase involved disintegration of autophagic bodies